MLNFIWLGLLIAGVVVAGLTGRLDAINQSVLNAAKSAVMDVALPLIGAMALWLGIVRLAEKAGLIKVLADRIRPLTARLFPDIPPDHPAMGAMMMNIAANMLGVSNAATPLGLKAMTQLNKLNSKPGVATNAMCTFLALNTSSIQLVPATAITILSINGARNPTAIVGSTLISTSIATIAAILIVKVLQRFGPFRWERQPAPAQIANTEAESRNVGGPDTGTERETPGPMKPWGPWVVGALLLIFLGIFFVQIASPLEAPSSQNLFGGIARFFRALSPLAVPFLLTFFPLYAASRQVQVYSEFVDGAKEGFQIAIRIIPYLVGMLVAIGVFRESGCLEILKNLLQPVLSLARIPSELIPMILMRPLSGSGSIAVLSDLVKQFGPDNVLSYMAATIYGSAETTFYVVAVYFGSVGISRTRHAIPAGLLADMVGVIAAILACRLLFGG
ncbi:MAG: nucleoside recognition domain-containing protein [Chthoniobacterales bacterium]